LESQFPLLQHRDLFVQMTVAGDNRAFLQKQARHGHLVAMNHLPVTTRVQSLAINLAPLVKFHRYLFY
jgi:hypothetical protein